MLMSKEVNAKRAAKGLMPRPVRTAVIGYPNVGKSAGLSILYSNIAFIKFSVSVPRNADLLETEGLFTQGWGPGRTFGEAVGGILVTDSSGWSSVIRHHTLDTRSDTEFKPQGTPSASK
jgi:hypothetical protein